MKKISYLCSTYLISCATLAHANIFSPDTHLSVYTKSTTSVAESSDFIKLAAVYPLSGNGGMTFKAPKATSCAAGYESYNGKCIKKCDRSVYPLASKPDSTKGTYTSCAGVTTYYGYTSCNTGWVLKDHKCVESVCSGYPYDEQPSSSHGTVISCKAGEKTYYKYTFCNNGWNLSSGTCVPQSCSASDYPYQSDPGNTAGTVVSCKTATATLYGYGACNIGWNKTNGYCNKNICDTTVYPYTSKGQAVGCNNRQECRSGLDSYFGCGNGGCQDSYYASGTQCIACTWNGYILTSCPTGGICTDNTCGNVKKYYVTNCNSNYYKSGDTCIACTWNGYTLTSCPSNGVCANSACGGTTKYSLTSCASGYEKSGNSCNACTWNGYTLTSCPSYGICANSTCGGTTKYSLTSCASGYEKSGNSCNACTWNGYTLTSCPSYGTCANSACGGTTKYSLTSCASGYEKSGNSCNACTWNGYTLTSCPSYGICANSTCGGTTKYSLTSCASGYEISGASCVVACSSCSVGSVLYAGGTCDASCASGEAVGVVIDPNSRFIYALIEFDGERGVSSAEERCHGKTWGGYTWRLPTLSESTTIMNNISAIQGSLNNVGTPVSDRGYWTSTEYSGSCGSEPCNYDYHVLSANHAQSPAYRSQGKPFRCVANY